MIADTKARRRRSGLGSDTAEPDCSAFLRRRDDRDQAPFREFPMIADTKARRRRSGLGSDTAEPDCSAIERHRDDRDQAPFPISPTIADSRRAPGTPRGSAMTIETKILYLCRKSCTARFRRLQAIEKYGIKPRWCPA